MRTHLGLDDVPVWGSAAATGDGLRMAQEVGADLWHMDNMMAVNGITEPGSRHGYFAMFVHSRGVIWVDDTGQRFVDEFVLSGHGQALIDGKYVLHPQRSMWVVFDEHTRSAGPISGSADVLPVGWNVLMNGYRWSADNIAEIEAGWIQRGDTLDELASATGLPADALAEGGEAPVGTNMRAFSTPQVPPSRDSMRRARRVRRSAGRKTEASTSPMRSCSAGSREPRGSTHHLNVEDRHGRSRTSAGTSRDLLHNGGRMWHYS